MSIFGKRKPSRLPRGVILLLQRPDGTWAGLLEDRTSWTAREAQTVSGLLVSADRTLVPAERKSIEAAVDCTPN